MQDRRDQPDRFDKRGGYPSSSKPASQLKPPPSGPAPGAKPKADQQKQA